MYIFFFFQAEDGIRDLTVTGVQTCALPIYGGEIRTPNIDRLARDGLRFTQFYNSARCWPSRVALLSGYYAQHVGGDYVSGARSEERRVGKGGRAGWGAEQ